MSTHSGQLIIGTRGSQMALVQAKQVADELISQNPDLIVKLEIITTKGDTNYAPIPLDTVGKEWFTKEIEVALLDNTIDLAVHSLKDLPPETPAGLVVLPVLVRDDPRDALVTKGTSLSAMPKGAVVGTDSLRRKALLLEQRPDLTIKSARGNANTRLKKLEEGQYDGLVMAVAGLRRIGKAEAITEFFDPTVFVPAIGQGALAVEVRANRPELLTMLKKLVDMPTKLAVDAERAFAQVIGGGCKLPIGCYAHLEDETVRICAMVGSMDARTTITKSISGPAHEAIRLAQKLATILAKEPIVAEYRHGAE